MARAAINAEIAYEVLDSLLDVEDVASPSARVHDIQEKTNVKILLIEDVTADALLTRIALDATHIPYTLTRLPRGDEVLPRLLNVTQIDMPDVILLDLGLPGMDGFEVMETMARMPNFLRAIPIIILTGYQGFDYLNKNYPLLIKTHLSKPVNPEQLREALAGLRDGGDR